MNYTNNISPAFYASKNNLVKNINFNNAEGSLEYIKTLKPDKVSLEMNIPGFDTVEFTFPYKQLKPKSQKIVENLINIYNEIGKCNSAKEKAKVITKFLNTIPDIHK